jgi:hypothetical protein
MLNWFFPDAGHWQPAGEGTFPALVDAATHHPGVIAAGFGICYLQ